MHATLPPSDRLETIALIGDEGPFLEPAVLQRRRIPWHLVALLFLTVLAGVSRFVSLDRPGIWVDEASTFRRVSGTYEQMLKTLEFDYFGPLFYSAEWVVRQFHVLNPFYLRLVPAIAGTLMIPAMYFLARQFCSIRTSLVTALLTLCSAFMINYGRDAKMYMTFWLFVALSAGAFFWWVRTRTWTAWLSWIAASCAMMGLNPWGGVLLAFMPLWLLTARKVHWIMGLGLIAGLAVIAAGPIVYYTQFNKCRDRTAERGEFAGISWLSQRNEGAGAPELIADSAAAFYYKFTFLQESDNPRVAPPQNVLSAAIIALTTILALLTVGLLPWRKATDPVPPTTLEPWWRPTLWLGTWIVVSCYLFYCISIRHPIAPRDWAWAFHEFIGYHWLGLTLLILGATVAISFFPRVQIGVLIGWVLLAAGLLVYALATPVTDGVLRSRVIVDQWLSLLFDWRMAWPTLVLLPAVAIARSAPTLRQRGFHLLMAALIVAGLYLVLNAMHAVCTATIDGMIEKGVTPSSIWIPRYLGFIWPAVAIVTAVLLVRLPVWPLRWAAIMAFCAANLFVAWHRVYDPNEPPLDRIVADIYMGTDQKSSVRTFVKPVRMSGGPGAGSLEYGVGPYYAYSSRTDLVLSPSIVAHWNMNYLPLPNITVAPRLIGYLVRNSTHVNRVITWQPIYPSSDLPADENATLPDPNEPDAVLRRLGSKWKLEREEMFPVRYHWSWGELYVYRRREYVKIATTTQPAASTQQAH